jgi:hypothetical protein
MSTLQSTIVEWYTVDRLSLAEIAAKLRTYPNKIRRLLIKAGISLRDKAAAQRNYLEKNPENHPKKIFTAKRGKKGPINGKEISGS